jgi:hypothetical protein
MQHAQHGTRLLLILAFIPLELLLAAIASGLVGLSSTSRLEPMARTVQKSLQQLRLPRQGMQAVPGALSPGKKTARKSSWESGSKLVGAS